MDFSKDSLPKCLLAGGFDKSEKSFFSWLGVTYSLSVEAIEQTLSALSELCAPGSSLGFDYPDENFFAAAEKRVQNTIMMAKAGGEAMQSAFSCAELEKLLQNHGFQIRELLTPADIQRNIIDRAGASMRAFEHVNYCHAVKHVGKTNEIETSTAPDGTIIYAGNGEETTSFEINIPETGPYTVAVQARHAEGRIHIRLKAS